jgi:thiosulfate dehydrogenase [quinone] large subunit
MIWKRRAAYALVRTVMGVLFLLNGLLKISGGLENFRLTLRESMADTLLPMALVSAFGTVLPFVELGLGVLLLLGLFTAEVLLATGALMVVLTFGTVLQAQDASVVANNVFYREEMGEAPSRAEMLPPLPREPARRWVAAGRPRTRSRVDQRR